MATEAPAPRHAERRGGKGKGWGKGKGRNDLSAPADSRTPSCEPPAAAGHSACGKGGRHPSDRPARGRAGGRGGGGAAGRRGGEAGRRGGDAVLVQLLHETTGEDVDGCREALRRHLGDADRAAEWLLARRQPPFGSEAARPAVPSPPAAAGGSGAAALRRGRNGAHLLNFTTPERVDESRPAPRPRAVPRSSAKPAAGSLGVPLSRREATLLYLQANNFHFLVPPLPAAARKAYLHPDVPVPWERVRAVRHVTPQWVRCPICLSDALTAPQVSGCGHILCLPCALRYSSAADGPSALKCPLCAQLLELEELRSVMMHHVAPVREMTEDEAKRESGATVAFRKVRTDKAQPLECVADAMEVACTARPCARGFTEARRFESLVARELSELAESEAQLLEQLAAARCLGDAAGSEATRRDGAALSTRSTWGAPHRAAAVEAPRSVATQANLIGGVSVEECEEELFFVRMAADMVRQRAAAWALTDSEAEEGGGAASDPTHAASPLAEEEADGCEEAAEWVLQAADGQFAFADALSARLVVDHFGSWEACPAVLEAPVVELHSHQQSEADASRRRFKPQAHLPVGATFALCELALRGVVSEAVLSSAREALDKRAERRARAREEEARAEAAERRRREKERQRYGKSELARELERLNLAAGHVAHRLAEEAPSIEVHEEWQRKWEQQQTAFADSFQTPSFAAMVEKGYSASGPALGSSPALKPRASPESAPSRASPDGGAARSPAGTAGRGLRSSASASSSEAADSVPPASLPSSASEAACPAGSMLERSTDEIGGGSLGARATKKSRKKVMDPAMLGFSVESSRIMQGEIEQVD
ncbi:hypothetical protein AB1Y20_012484 [Prymnesium parvum]|uniref:RING-type domain-containing protein n=1 Tax=Prymnesium parvum TaxID=97485 RepID=A0AB34IJY9_PRYPA